SASFAEEKEAEARESARQALQKERLTQKALAEVETTLFDGLLRPLGRRDGPLDPAEGDALRKLAGLPGARMRLRFIEAGLGQPDTARRLALRADWVTQAVVGLDPARRRQLADLMQRRLAEAPETSDARAACVRVLANLGVATPDLAGILGGSLAARLGK